MDMICFAAFVNWIGNAEKSAIAKQNMKKRRMCLLTQTHPSSYFCESYQLQLMGIRTSSYALWIASYALSHKGGKFSRC